MSITPDLIFELLATESNTVIRRVLEAHFIFDIKPEINNKEECSLLHRADTALSNLILFDIQCFPFTSFTRLLICFCLR